MALLVFLCLLLALFLEHLLAFLVAAGHVLLDLDQLEGLVHVVSSLVRLDLLDMLALHFDALDVLAHLVDPLLALVVAQLVLLLHLVSELNQTALNQLGLQHLGLHARTLPLQGLLESLQVSLELLVSPLAILLLCQAFLGLLLLAQLANSVLLLVNHLLLSVAVLLLVLQDALGVLLVLSQPQVQLFFAGLLAFLHLLGLLLHDQRAALLVCRLAFSQGGLDLLETLGLLNLLGHLVVKSEGALQGHSWLDVGAGHLAHVKGLAFAGRLEGLLERVEHAVFNRVGE